MMLLTDLSKSSYVDVDERIVDEEMGIEISDLKILDISLPEPPKPHECLSEYVNVGVEDGNYKFTSGEKLNDTVVMEISDHLTWSGNV